MSVPKLFPEKQKKEMKGLLHHTKEKGGGHCTRIVQLARCITDVREVYANQDVGIKRNSDEDNSLSVSKP